MKLTFWGVRGSIPSPGPHTARYGGNTSCLEVTAPDGGPPLVLDCGTGARALGRTLVERHERRVEVLFTHFHMDHVFGFPFFGPVYAPSCRVGVTVPAGSVAEAESKLGRYLNGTYHPVRLRDVEQNLSLAPVRVGHAVDRGAFKVLPLRLNHPGGACGYRIETGGRVLLYLTDTAPLAQPGEGLVAGGRPPALERRLLSAMQEADLVVMDTTFTFDEYLEKMTWGHAYPEYAVALCEAAGVRRLALFHHAPDASDDQLDALGEHWSQHDGDVDVFLAREGGVVDLEG